MKTYYGVKRNIFKGNKPMPEETIIYPYIYSAEEEAWKFAMEDADVQVLHFNHKPAGCKLGQNGYTMTIQEIYSSKTQKTTVYRHEWEVVKFETRGEE